MMPSPQAFTETLRRIPLLTSAQQVELTSALQTRTADAKTLARQLLQRGWLTSFQVNQLFLGRGPDLVLGPYVLLERLGEGGAGHVFKARHLHMNRVVALKLIRKELLADRETLARFQREIQLISTMTHPHVVHAYDAGPVGSNYFLVMEYVEGADLGRVIKKAPLSVELACTYLRQAALGLPHIHERGLIHRDIKPSNLFVVRPSDDRLPGQVKILDLGLARLQRPIDGEGTGAVTGDVVTIGTLDYMPPEQALDFHHVDIRGDVYSLGCTFHYALSGAPPFPDGTVAQKLMRHQQVEPPPLRNVPADVAGVLRRMMAKRPQDRFQTPGEILAALPAPTATLLPAVIPSSSLAATKPLFTLRTAPLPRVLPRRLALPTWQGAPRSRRGRLLLGLGASSFLTMFLLLAFLVVRFGSAPAGDRGQSGGVFLSDLPEQKARVYWMARFGKDGNLGVENRRITLNGVIAAKGLGMHPGDRDTAAVTYSLQGQYRTFKAKVALNDSATRCASPLLFVVLGDGKPLWQSQPVQRRGDQQDCEVAIRGVDKLELLVTCAGPHGDAHAVWIDPVVK